MPSIDLDRIDQVVSPAAVEEYWERGFWKSPKLFDDEQIARLRAAHERFWAREHDRLIPSQYGLTEIDLNSPRLRQDCNGFWLNDEIRAAVTSPILGALAARLMKTNVVRLWHDQVIYKPGQGPEGQSDAGNVGWHQDYGFWRACSTTNLCTAWIALQDTDESNGAMRFVVGSHRWGLLEGSDTFHVKDLDQLAARFAAEDKGEWREEIMTLRAGEVSFHHALTFHGSGPNLTQAPRLSVVAHLMPGDTVYRAGRQWHPNLVFLGPNAYDGQPFIGDFWPQLWP